MQEQKAYENLINYLRSAIGLLDLERDAQLRKDVISICDYFQNPTYRIAVFGPFNHGKSTLINALLGKKTLPIDLIPTTGAAIYVRYSEQLHTKIILTDGTEISEDGTEVLKRYAVLDEQRCMRSDVASVEVCCRHPFLKTGVEFLDLPGTNDREAQEDLVKDKLLTADLIVQVLDARKLMTLGEREQLRDWLLDRGIKTVVFVVNFVNLLEPEEQKEVYHRLRFVAGSFRAELPSGISNLYRVDALPALRARLKGDTSAAQTTGLIAFESALQNIVAAQHEKLAIRLPRLQAVVERVKQVGEAKQQELSAQIEAEKQKQQHKIEIKQKAEKLIKQGWQKSISDFEGWLYLPKLLSCHQQELALALKQDAFKFWQLEKFKPEVEKYQQAIDEWVNKGCEFFENESPGQLSVVFPTSPLVSFPEPPTSNSNSNDTDNDIASVAIPAGLGFVLGGPMGAAVLGGASYILNKTVNRLDQSESAADYTEIEFDRAYAKAAEEYLTCFSKQVYATLEKYKKKAVLAIAPKLIDQEAKQTEAYYQLQLLNSLLDNLQQELELLVADLG